MTKVKRWLKWLDKWEYTWLCLLVVITLAAHFSLINHPKEVVFDEVYYVNEANSILADNGTLRPEHPPLGKLFITAGVAVFGNNPFGWRFFSIVCGTACIILFYLICRRLNMSRRTAILGTFLLALENMSFVQAGLAMLDVYSLVFAIASFWLYLKGYYPLATVFVGLSALAKLYGALAIIPIVLHWLLARRDRQVHFVASILLAPISFVLLMPLFEFFIFRRFVNPFDRIYTMLSLSGGLTFTNVSHAYKSRPWMWILKPELIPYWYNPNYLGAVSYTIWGLIIPSVGYMVWRAIKRVDAALFGISWFIGTYLMWIPMAIVTDRVTYPFYFYPTIGAICIGVGLGISQLIDIWQKRKTGKLRWVIIGVVGIYLVAHVLVFAWMSPLSYWWGIPSIFIRK